MKLMETGVLFLEPVYTVHVLHTIAFLSEGCTTIKAIATTNCRCPKVPGNSLLN